MPAASGDVLNRTPCPPRLRITVPIGDMNSSFHLSPKTLFRDDDGAESDDRMGSPPSSSDLNSSTDSGVVRTSERSPSVPVLKVRPVPRQDTPPYKRIRALRLFGSPQTPKTLLQRSEASSTVDIGPRQRTHLVDVGANVNPFSPLQTTPPLPRSKRPRKCFSLLRLVGKFKLQLPIEPLRSDDGLGGISSTICS